MTWERELLNCYLRRSIRRSAYVVTVQIRSRALSLLMIPRYYHVFALSIVLSTNYASRFKLSVAEVE